MDDHSPMPHPLPDTATKSERSSLDGLSLSSSTVSERSFPASTPRAHRPSSEGPRPTPVRPQVLSGRLRPASSFNTIRKNDSYCTVPDEERYSVGVTHHIGARVESGQRQFPRSDPDGQSEISETAPDLLSHHPLSSNSAPPHRLSIKSRSSVSPLPRTSPSTLTHQPNEGGVAALRRSRSGPAQVVTPAMIQSALDALEGIQDKATPISLCPHHISLDSASRQSPVLPEDVTTALTAWISSQSLHMAGVSGYSSRSSVPQTPLVTPPPTPRHVFSSEDSPGNGDVKGRQGISAGDLISALATLMGLKEEKTPSSQGSRVCSVPACTPREGLNEWTKLGIHPEEVIEALSALTIQQVRSVRNRDESKHHLIRAYWAKPILCGCVWVGEWVGVCVMGRWAWVSECVCKTHVMVNVYVQIFLIVKYGSESINMINFGMCTPLTILFTLSMIATV